MAQKIETQVTFYELSAQIGSYARITPAPHPTHFKIMVTFI